MKPIDITKSADPVRVLNNAIEPGINPPNTKIIYRTSESSWELWRDPVAKEAMRLYELGKVHLVQEIVCDSPRVYNYMVILK